MNSSYGMMIVCNGFPPQHKRRERPGYKESGARLGLFPDTVTQPSALVTCQSSLWCERGPCQLPLSSSQARHSSQKAPGPVPSREFVCSHLTLEAKMNRHGLFHAAWLQHSGMLPSTSDLLTWTWPKHLLYSY